MTNQIHHDDEDLVTVATCATEVEASILVNVLRDAGIKAVAVGGFTAGFRAEAPGWVQVKTLAEDAERSKVVISEIRPLTPAEMDQLEDDV